MNNNLRFEVFNWLFFTKFQVGFLYDPLLDLLMASYCLKSFQFFSIFSLKIKWYSGGNPSRWAENAFIFLLRIFRRYCYIFGAINLRSWMTGEEKLSGADDKWRCGLPPGPKWEEPGPQSRSLREKVKLSVITCLLNSFVRTSHLGLKHCWSDRMWLDQHYFILAVSCTDFGQPLATRS